MDSRRDRGEIRDSGVTATALRKRFSLLRGLRKDGKERRRKEGKREGSE